MADLNVTYNPYVHSYDIRAIKNEVLYEFLPSNVRAEVDVLLVQLEEFNSSQNALVEAVKMPYTGSTSAERRTWLKARIEAVFDRLDQIRTDAEGNKQQIIKAGGDVDIDSFALISAGLSILPATRLVGLFAGVVAKLLDTSNNDQAYKASKIQQANEVLSGYTGDVQQLNAIYKQLNAEYTGAGNVPTWVYLLIVGVIILLLVVLIIRRRQR